MKARIHPMEAKNCTICGDRVYTYFCTDNKTICSTCEEYMIIEPLESY